MANSTSSQSSGVTGGDLFNSVEHEHISNLLLLEKEPSSSEWTDEKHSLYLKSIETSFIHQLYHSIDSSHLHSHKKQTSCMRSSKHNESHAADQIYQHGCWQRIKLGRGEPPPQKAGKSHRVVKNPWIQHYRSRGDQTIQDHASFRCQPVSCGGRATFTRTFANISDDLPICPDSSISEEFSGQNFDEEDNVGRTYSLHKAKKMKTTEVMAQNMGSSICETPLLR